MRQQPAQLLDTLLSETTWKTLKSMLWWQVQQRPLVSARPSFRGVAVPTRGFLGSTRYEDASSRLRTHRPSPINGCKVVAEAVAQEQQGEQGLFPGAHIGGPASLPLLFKQAATSWATLHLAEGSSTRHLMEVQMGETLTCFPSPRLLALLNPAQLGRPRLWSGQPQQGRRRRQRPQPWH